jgi:hypothetical protein
MHLIHHIAPSFPCHDKPKHPKLEVTNLVIKLTHTPYSPAHHSEPAHFGRSAYPSPCSSPPPGQYSFVFHHLINVNILYRPCCYVSSLDVNTTITLTRFTSLISPFRGTDTSDSTLNALQHVTTAFTSQCNAGKASRSIVDKSSPQPTFPPHFTTLPSPPLKALLDKHGLPYNDDEPVYTWLRRRLLVES